MRSDVLAAGILSLTALTGCHPVRVAPPLSELDRTAISSADAAFSRSAQAVPRDDRASAAIYAEDAIVLAPGQAPIQGRAAIAAFLGGFPPFRDYRLDVLEVDGRGDMAYERGTASMTIVQPGGAPVVWRSNYLLIWRKQADRSWKVTREVFTPAAGEAPAEATAR